ncbi:MAG: hypothetical protein MZV63_06190, partial [Marinilabiliales bacterium]|nr:hypothetical protein [Marinilabiliales bacterium]
TYCIRLNRRLQTESTAPETVLMGGLSFALDRFGQAPEVLAEVNPFFLPHRQFADTGARPSGPAAVCGGHGASLGAHGHHAGRHRAERTAQLGLHFWPLGFSRHGPDEAPASRPC